MKRFLAVLLLLVAALGTPSWAQTVVTYYADDLERSPGVIYVTKGFNTIIQFYDRVDVYTITRSEVVQVQELDPSTLWFVTQQSQGMTGMTVMINGRVLQFTLVVKPGDYNRTYRVEPSRAVYGPRASVGAPPSEASPQVTKEAPAPQPSRKETTPIVAFSWKLASLDAAKGRAVVQYTAKNLLGEDIYLDVGRLALRQAGKALSYSITRTPARVRVAPGETQTGTLAVRLADTGAPLEVEWTATTSDGRSERYRQILPLASK